MLAVLLAVLLDAALAAESVVLLTAALAVLLTAALAAASKFKRRFASCRACARLAARNSGAAMEHAIRRVVVVGSAKALCAEALRAKAI